MFDLKEHVYGWLSVHPNSQTPFFIREAIRKRNEMKYDGKDCITPENNFQP